MGLTRDFVIAEIKRTAEANGGRALGRKRFFTETGIRESDWSGKYWARWSDALAEAGVVGASMNPALSDDVVLRKLADFVVEAGHFPVNTELRLRARTDPEFPSHNTFATKYGSKSSLAARLLEFCRDRTGYETVVRICQPLAEARAAGQPASAPVVNGVVYLFKSGRFYKIGRTNSLGRREYELGIQLPEKLTLVHSIVTDDPVGIEAYWHRRFELLRKNGEWFQLSPADVSAFKRRKFM